MKKVLLLSLMALAIPFAASAYVPNILKVTPKNNAVVSEISKISIEYIGGGYYPEAWWTASSPEVQINNVPVAGTASSDPMDDAILYFTLQTPITAPGEYTIKIPANQFMYDYDYEYDNSELTWNVTIEGEPEPGGFEPISNPVTIFPEQGYYSFLQNFVITFRHSYVDYNSTKTCYLMKDDDTETIVATAKPAEGAGMANGDVDFATPITTPGTYILVVPEGAFYNYLTDGDEPEYRFRFVVEEGAQSPVRVDNIEVWPANNSEVETLDLIEILFVDYSSVYENHRNNMPIEVMNQATGEVVAAGEIDLGSSGMASNQANIYIEPTIELPGTYTVSIPYKTFVLEGAAMYDGQNSAPIELTYTIPGDQVGISAIATDSKASAIYRIDGTRVNANSTEALPAGLYIIDGKKVSILK